MAEPQPEVRQPGAIMDIMSRSQARPQQNSFNSLSIPSEGNRASLFGEMSREGLENVIRAKNAKIRELEDEIRELKDKTTLLEKEVHESKKIDAEFMDAVTEWNRKGAASDEEWRVGQQRGSNFPDFHMYHGRWYIVGTIRG
jgi:hypothetical protein